MIKIYILFLPLFLLFNIVTTAQNIGAYLGFATSNSIVADGHYVLDRNSYHVGLTYQFSSAVGKLVTTQLSNYGRTVSGEGNSVFTIDLGYSRLILPNFFVLGQFSIGGKSYFTNYVDNRFSGGGYHMNTKTDLVLGVGFFAGYFVTKNIALCAGFNSATKINIGIRLDFQNAD